MKAVKKTATRGQIRDSITQSPQWYYTSTDDNYKKTTATFTKDDIDKSFTFIKGVSQLGFRHQNGTFFYGPVLAFPKLVMSWQVPTVDDISEESLMFFTMLEPKLDVLLIGVGDAENIEKVRRRISPFLTKNQLRAEVMSTWDASSTFNFLNADGRAVAACLYPPDKIGNPSAAERASLLQAEGYEMSELPQTGKFDPFGLPGHGRGLFDRVTDTVKRQKYKLQQQEKEMGGENEVRKKLEELERRHKHKIDTKDDV